MPALPARAQVLAEKGHEARAATEALIGALADAETSTGQREELLAVLDDALKLWTPEAVAAVVRAVAHRVGDGRPLVNRDLHRWLQAHQPQDWELAVDCIEIRPPEQLQVVRRLSQIGSQKVVYEAVWEASNRSVMLKRFLNQDVAARLLKRELQPHPLSMEHPNIIETHLFTTSSEPFLVEKRLWRALDDNWSAQGTREAAALLHDIASALAFLRDEGLVHGDVKPDNIGYEDGRYILLDFGISRRSTEFSADTTATGSVRTRAPELLLQESAHSFESDVWALGATVLNAVAGCFPLINPNDQIPRVTEPERRAEFEAELARRAQEELDDRVERALSAVRNGALRELLEATLRRRPDERPAADDLARRCRSQLESLISTPVSGSAPDRGRGEQVAQLTAYLPSSETLALLSVRKKMELRARLSELRSSPTLDGDEREGLERLETRIDQFLETGGQ